MVIDEYEDSVNEKTEEKTEDVPKPLVSYEISADEEMETIIV